MINPNTKYQLIHELLLKKLVNLSRQKIMIFDDMHNLPTLPLAVGLKRGSSVERLFRDFLMAIDVLIETRH